MLYTRIQNMFRSRARRHRRHVEISAPFGFKREPLNLPGISQEEISLLREKAAASQFAPANARREAPAEHETSRPCTPSCSAPTSSSGGEEPRARELGGGPLWC